MHTQEMVSFCQAEHDRLVGLLVLHLGDRWTAEELAQDALLRACERWHEVRKTGSRRAWLNRVALNLANSWLRRRMAERRALARHGSVTTADHADNADAVAVRGALALLSQREREAILLRYWGGLSVAETAEAMGDIAPATVRSFTHRAVTTLREHFSFEVDLEPEPIDEEGDRVA